MDSFVQLVTSLLGGGFNAVTLIAFDYTASGKGSWLMCGPEALRCCQDCRERNLPSWLWPRHIIPNQITELKTVFQRRFKRPKPAGNLIHLFQDPSTKYILVTRGCLLDLVSKKNPFYDIVLLGTKRRKLWTKTGSHLLHKEPVRLSSYEYITKC